MADDKIKPGKIGAHQWRKPVSDEPQEAGICEWCGVPVSEAVKACPGPKKEVKADVEAAKQ